MALATAALLSLSSVTVADLGRAELITYLLVREARLSAYSAEFIERDRAAYWAAPDVAALRLNVEPGRYQWDIDFELGPDDRGAELHATIVNNGTEVLHWHRTLDKADLFAAPAGELLRHLTPKQNSWVVLYFWPPVPGVPAYFDPKNVLADPTSVILAGGIGGESIVVSGSIEIDGDTTPYPIEFHLSPSRGFAVERLRFIGSGDELRATEWLEVVPNELWVPSAIVLGDQAYWSAVDAGGAADAPQADREVILALDASGLPLFSLAADPVPDDLVALLPAGTLVHNAMTKASLIAGANEAPSQVVVFNDPGQSVEVSATSPPDLPSWLIPVGGLAFLGAGAMIRRRGRACTSSPE